MSRPPFLLLLQVEKYLLWCFLCCTMVVASGTQGVACCKAGRKCTTVPHRTAAPHCCTALLRITAVTWESKGQNTVKCVGGGQSTSVSNKISLEECQARKIMPWFAESCRAPLSPVAFLCVGLVFPRPAADLCATQSRGVARAQDMMLQPTLGNVQDTLAVFLGAAIAGTSRTDAHSLRCCPRHCPRLTSHLSSAFNANRRTCLPMPATDRQVLRKDW